MPRDYHVSADAVAVSATQDLLQIKGAAGKTLRVKRLYCKNTDTTLATAQMLQFRVRFLPATVTDGSGGSTGTIKPFDPGDAAASFTVLTNNTSKATTSGTANELDAGAEHIYSGYDVRFERPPIVGPSESVVFELLSTVSGTVHLSSGAVVEETGG